MRKWNKDKWILVETNHINIALPKEIIFTYSQTQYDVSESYHLYFHIFRYFLRVYSTKSTVLIDTAQGF